MDLEEFELLIDDYQGAQRDGGLSRRAKARGKLKDAWRDLEAERDALRVDAERYRWLRDMSCSRDPEKQRLALDTLDRGEWWSDKDAWIDAAMRESEEQS